MMYTLALSLHLPIPDPKYQPTGRLPKQYLPALYAKLRACLAVACDRNIVDRLDIAIYLACNRKGQAVCFCFNTVNNSVNGRKVCGCRQ